MVAQNAVRTYGLNQVFRFVKGIWLHQKRPQIHTCATYARLPSYISTMISYVHALTAVCTFKNASKSPSSGPVSTKKNNIWRESEVSTYFILLLQSRKFTLTSDSLSINIYSKSARYSGKLIF